MPTRRTCEWSAQARAAPTWWSSTRQMRVSCSRTIPATVRTGIAAANCSSSASNSRVNPDPSRAHGTPTWRTPCSGQRTRGSRACRNALCWKKSMCRHVLSAVSCTGHSRCAQSLPGHPNRAPRGKSRNRSSRAPRGSNSTRSTRHGGLKPSAAVNNPDSSIPKPNPPSVSTPTTEHHPVNEAIGATVKPRGLPRRFRSSAPGRLRCRSACHRTTTPPPQRRARSTHLKQRGGPARTSR